MRRLTIRLGGHRAPEGTVRALDAHDLGEAVRVLVYRLTREAAERPGLGRAGASVESLAAVAVATAPQGNALVFHLGDPEQLVDDPWGERVDESLGQLLRAVAANHCPASVSYTVAQAVDELVRALQAAAAHAEVLLPGGNQLHLETRLVSRELWRARIEPPPQRRTVRGRLEMVDVASGRFRVRTDDGEKVALTDVADTPATARLVDQPVVAEGLFVRPEGQRQHRLEQVVVRSVEESEGRLPLTYPPRRRSEPFVPIGPIHDLWPELSEPVQDELPT